ncbi:uncharacterized protein [Centruroides vittatus]|uniref:uncharacterized protein n=1 Tax=Centruroides vittatus TaxID=120091 RepID=UPI00350EDBE6
MAEGTDFSEVLINEVRKYPWLYDIRRADYKDNINKNNSWTQISKKLNGEESLVKKRWQNIRDQYRRKCKEENLPSGSGGHKRQQWTYFNMLSFLRPGVEQINTISNFVEEKDSSQNYINLGEANTGNNSEDSNKEFENVQLNTFEMPCPETILTVENDDINDCLKACSSTSSSSGSTGCNKKKRKNDWEKELFDLLKTTNTPIVETKHDSDYYYFMSLSERFREIKCKKKK